MPKRPMSNRPMDRQALMNMIKAQFLLERLQKHAFGKLAEPMTDSQIRAAEFLLKRAMPEVKISEMTATHMFNGDPASISNAALINELLDRKPGNNAGGARRRTH